MGMGRLEMGRTEAYGNAIPIDWIRPQQIEELKYGESLTVSIPEGYSEGINSYIYAILRQKLKMLSHHTLASQVQDKYKTTFVEPGVYKITYVLPGHKLSVQRD